MLLKLSLIKISKNKNNYNTINVKNLKDKLKIFLI